VTNDKSPVEEVVEMLNDPSIIITIEPMGADKISDFMLASGRVKTKPDSWKGYYFENIDALKGN
jgi:sulfonate transport system substrate-binding protein